MNASVCCRVAAHYVFAASNFQEYHLQTALIVLIGEQTMKACATAGGGVMFIPETLERKNAVSYREILEKETEKAPVKPFGKRAGAPKKQSQAA